MPFFYDLTRLTTTNGTPNTLSTHLRLLTISNQESCKLTGLTGAMRNGTAGGAELLLTTPNAAGTGGTAQTPYQRHPRSPSADTTVFNDASAITAGNGPTVRAIAGCAQTGGTGGWVAVTPDAAVTLKPNGGGGGNAEVGSLANAATQNIRIMVEFAEGG